MRLNELANIKTNDIDWENYTTTIWGKGNKQRKAPFTERSARLVREQHRRRLQCSGRGICLMLSLTRLMLVKLLRLLPGQGKLYGQSLISTKKGLARIIPGVDPLKYIS